MDLMRVMLVFFNLILCLFSSKNPEEAELEDTLNQVVSITNKASHHLKMPYLVFISVFGRCLIIHVPTAVTLLYSGINKITTEQASFQWFVFSVTSGVYISHHA